jgi:hypothetical protein
MESVCLRNVPAAAMSNREDATAMMEGGMGPMMGWMMGFGWVVALAILALLIAGVVVLVRTLDRRDRTAQPPTAGTTVARVALIALAALGGIVLVAATAMAVMHAGMGCCTFG